MRRGKLLPGLECNARVAQQRAEFQFVVIEPPAAGLTQLQQMVEPLLRQRQPARGDMILA